MVDGAPIGLLLTLTVTGGVSLGLDVLPSLLVRADEMIE
jgi:hypothetical protein